MMEEIRVLVDTDTRNKIVAQVAEHQSMIPIGEERKMNFAEFAGKMLTSAVIQSLRPCQAESSR